MKKLFFLVSFFFCVAVDAQQLEVNRDGQYRFSSDEEKWEKSEIRYAPQAKEFLNHFREAVSRPGDSIVVGTEVSFQKVLSPFKVLKQHAERLIVFDPKAKLISYEERTYRREESFWGLLFVGISIILVFLSGLSFNKGWPIISVLLSCSAVLMIFISTISLKEIGSWFFLPGIFLAPAASFAILLAISRTTNRTKIVRGFSIAFYVSVFVSLIWFFFLAM